MVIFTSFQAVAIQQNINAVNDALQTLENLSRSSGRTFLSCYDLIQDASQIYNEASNSPASSALLQLANGIHSLGSTSCSQSQKAAVIQLLMSALDKLEGNLNNIRESIIEQGIISKNNHSIKNRSQALKQNILQFFRRDNTSSGWWLG